MPLDAQEAAVPRPFDPRSVDVRGKVVPDGPVLGPVPHVGNLQAPGFDLLQAQPLWPFGP